MKHKTAIITGGGGGIGLAILRRFIKDGYSVALFDKNEEALSHVLDDYSRIGASLRCFHIDIRDREAAEKALKETEESLGFPAILVNNAGIGGPFKELPDLTPEEWEEVLDVKIKGPFNFLRILLPGMARKKFGRVINIASLYGIRGGALSSAYIAANHALVGLTRSVAAEWGPRGITSNAVCPGYIDTAMGVEKGPRSDYANRVQERTPVRRLGSPEEIADMVSFLAREKSGYINGGTFSVDGGLAVDMGIV